MLEFVHPKTCQCPFHAGRTDLNTPVKSCGKRHAWCKICRPDVKFIAGKPFFKALHREGCQCWMHRSNIGDKNPNWKGGPANSNRVGWNAARRAVWKRDKVCRACGRPPYPQRRLDVHHVIARRDGGTNDQDNLVGLHHGCHMKVETGQLVITVP